MALLLLTAVTLLRVMATQRAVTDGDEGNLMLFLVNSQVLKMPAK